MKITKITLTLAVICLLASSSFASVTYKFQVITDNSSYGSDIAEQLSVVVDPLNTSSVSFTFHNSGPLNSTISNIYFDDGVPVLSSLDYISSSNSENVDFIEGSNPDNLPSGNAYNFYATKDLSSEADNPPPHNGVDPGQWVQLDFSILDGYNYDSVIQALNGQNLRIGLHVISLPDGQSESYINLVAVPVVPVPGALLLGSIGIGCVGSLKRRRSL